MNKTIPFVGNLSILTTASGGTDIPVAGGHIFGYCLTADDLTALDALKSGEVKEFIRKDGTKGKRQGFGTVSVQLEQCDAMDSVDVNGNPVVVPVYRFASKPTRADDRASKHFFG